MESVLVNLGERSYRIFIKQGIIEEAGDIIFSCTVGKTAAIITNSTVGPLYLSTLIKSLEASLFQVHVIELPDGEHYKTLSWMETIYDQLLSFNLDRTSPIIALGGGVIGDVTGFAAATFLRGVPYIQIPTTLLSQVDSSVGGKTGVNLPGGKNMVGAFYQPRVVIIDPSVLKTLALRELKAGLAEVIKYGIIRDKSFFSYLETTVHKALALDESALVTIIKTCCSIKADITSQDERESGLRAILNFGHTIGHAIETLTGYRQYCHGEAVSIGMATAAKLSAAWGYCTTEDSQKIIVLLETAGLPVTLPAHPAAQYLEAIYKDKKKLQGNIRMVLLKSIGDVFLHEVSSDKLLSSLKIMYLL
jgi:3-dehydroquinate synthase